jgi:hypothetical protein
LRHGSGSGSSRWGANRVKLHRATDGGGYDPEAIKTAILAEFADLKETAKSFEFQAIKDGTWFAKFVQSCLSSYDRKVMEQGVAAYLRGKYPGLPTDAIAGKLCEHLLEELPTLAQRFRREDGALDQALFAVGDVANRAGAKVGKALGWAGKQLSKVKPAEADAPTVEFEASVEEKTNAVILAGMERLTQRFAAGELKQEEYKSQFAVLVEQLKS